MADENDDWTIDDLDEMEDEPVVQQAERRADDDLTKLKQVTRKVAERQERLERQAQVERMTTEFYAKASEEAKQFADVLLAGVSDPEKVKKMIELANAKAEALAPPQEETPAEDEQTEEEDDGSVEIDGFAPPLRSGPPRVKDKWAEVAQRTRRGDTKAALQEFIHYSGGLPKKG